MSSQTGSRLGILDLQRFRRLGLKVLVLMVIWPVCCRTCYVYPPGKVNPCAEKTCRYGAICVASLDGLSARCMCQDKCYDFGDSVGSKPICGNDDKDYANFCELKKAACETMTIIKIKHYGKCGE